MWPIFLVSVASVGYCPSFQPAPRRRGEGRARQLLAPPAEGGRGPRQREGEGQASGLKLADCLNDGRGSLPRQEVPGDGYDAALIGTGKMAGFMPRAIGWGDAIALAVQ